LHTQHFQCCAVAAEPLLHSKRYYTLYMSVWKLPPIIKVYEALGALADKRIEVTGNTGKIYSSSGNKFYTVTYDPKTKSIMCNDNGSYWAEYLGYPAIAYLLKTEVIPYNPGLVNLLKDIMWKDLNQSFKNDFVKTEKYCKNLVVQRGGNLPALQSEIEHIHKYLEDHPLSLLGPKVKPPSGY
jgi:hypothetical protein